MLDLSDQLGLSGLQLGSYVVRQVVAWGGVAVIYRGEHEVLRNAVAIKVLTPELVDEAARPTLEQMFLREAQILSQLRSDDILRALHHGRVACPADGEERPYIVVDWLEGRSLSDELDDRRRRPVRPYSLDEALEVLEPIARALACCHESGIVHRDVNPRNVFLESAGHGRAPRAKLIDFGFAKEVARTEALRLQQVQGTLFARSPDYAAPEHYDREQYGELSENTDIYTLALMLVEMMTLQPPLRGLTDDDLRTSTADRNDRPTPNNRGARVSAAVEALFAEALSVDQFDRPGAVLEWWDRLKAAARAPEPPVAPSAPEKAPAPPAPASSLEGPQVPGVGGVDALERDFGRRAPSRRRGWGIAIVFLVLLGALGLGGAAVYLTRPLDCPTGYADCNGERADGCEAHLPLDEKNCGACGKVCRFDEGRVGCTDGECRITQCTETDRRDCNASIADGCEVDVRTDPNNCGECGEVCGTDGTKKVLCAESKCLLSCGPGRADCDGVAKNGCETSILKDEQNCGRCGFACVATACEEGLCSPSILAQPVLVGHISAQGDDLYVWDRENQRIDRIRSDGKRTTVVENARSVTALVAGTHRLFWASSEKREVLARALWAEDAPVRRIAGPLVSDTPLSLTQSGYVSWVNRSARSEAKKAVKRKAKARVPVFPHRAVFTASLDAVLDPAQFAVAQCEQWPKTFTGDDQGQYCCDVAQALSAVRCENGQCRSQPYNVVCPDELAADAERLYLANDVRVLSVDRESGKVKALAKRKKKPRLITLSGDYVYFLEGDREAEVYRVEKNPDGAASPELLARGQFQVTALAASERAIYWVARAREPAQSAKGATSPQAIYRLTVAER